MSDETDEFIEAKKEKKFICDLIYREFGDIAHQMADMVWHKEFTSHYFKNDGLEDSLLCWEFANYAIKELYLGLKTNQYYKHAYENILEDRD